MMEIKTTTQIGNKNNKLSMMSHNKKTNDEFNEYRKKKWVAYNDLIKEIDKHSNCSKHHMVGLLKFTCLDAIKGKLLGFDAITSDSRSSNGDSLNKD